MSVEAALVSTSWNARDWFEDAGYYLSFVGAGAGAGGGGMSTTATVGSNVWITYASCPWRENSATRARIRAASCGAWKPVEFSASTKSR